MTDIYLRRSDGPDPRRRAAVVLLVLLVLVAGGFFGYRYGCQDADTSDDLARQVESDPLVDELIDLPMDEDAPAEESRSSIVPVGLPARTSLPADVGETDSKPSSPPAATGPDSGIRLLTEARALLEEGAVVEARDKALEVLAASRNDAARSRAMDLLSGIATDLVMTPRNIPEKEEYVVRPGDSLARIAKKYHTTIELLQASNNVRGTVIRVGDRFRVLNVPFRIDIDKSINVLDLYLGDRFLKRYRVGTGEYNKTPVGDFKVTDRIAKPTWWRPDGKAIPYGTPENELGTHWLSLDVRGYGIHGTWEPDTIGKQASAGCVRLVNEEIEELYTMIPVGTSVTIHE